MHEPDTVKYPSDAELAFEKHLIGVKNINGKSIFCEFIFSDGSRAKFEPEFADSEYTEQKIQPEVVITKKLANRFSYFDNDD